jgi:hypothetical protein
VTIGKGSVVGANSVVTQDVPPYSVIAGAPAKTIGQRLNWNPKRSISADQEEDHPYILSGRIVKATTGRPACMEANLDTPLCFALDANESDVKLALEWHASIPVRIKIKGENYSLPVGSGKLELSSEVLNTTGSVHYCTISICGPVPSASLQISQVSIA